jgi:hypothetical protein
MFGIKKCHALLQAGRAMELEMQVPEGQFIRRPNNLLWVVNEPFAAALIYPAVLAAWTYLAVLRQPVTDRGSVARPRSQPRCLCRRIRVDPAL